MSLGLPGGFLMAFGQPATVAKAAGCSCRERRCSRVKLHCGCAMGGEAAIVFVAARMRAAKVAGDALAAPHMDVLDAPHLQQARATTPENTKLSLQPALCGVLCRMVHCHDCNTTEPSLCVAVVASILLLTPSSRTHTTVSCHHPNRTHRFAGSARHKCAQDNR